MATQAACLAARGAAGSPPATCLGLLLSWNSASLLLLNYIGSWIIHLLVLMPKQVEDSGNYSLHLVVV